MIEQPLSLTGQPKGPPARPDTGGTSIPAGTAVNFAWHTRQRTVLLQNDTGGDWYVKLNAAGASAADYHVRIKSGDPVHRIDSCTVEMLSIYAVAASTLAGTGQNCSVVGFI